jgi:ATP-dependent 26S proteasome regulatory subunit
MQDLAASILHLRCLWAHAVLVEELRRGRERGYFAGEPPDAAVEPSAIELHLRDIDVRPSEATPMGRLAHRFELSPREEATLWLLACCELEADLSHFVEHIASRGMHQLSVQHVQRMMGVSFAELDRLACFALVDVEMDPSSPIHRRRIRAKDRVLDLLQCGDTLDATLADIAELVPAMSSPFHGEARDRVLEILVGPEGDRDDIVLASATTPILRVRCSRISDQTATRTEQLRAIAREARWFGARPLFCGADALLSDDSFLRTVAATMTGIIYASAKAAPLSTGDLPAKVHELPPMDHEARMARWRAALPQAEEALVAECATRYRLPARVIAEVGRSTNASTAAVTVERVQELLRQRLDQRLVGFAKRVAWKQTWSDLVLPPDQFDLLVEMVARVRHRHQVLDSWGFASKVGKGTGTTTLLSGPPGTGKTMIAGLVAQELGLDLYQADLSKIVSKYIGETEQRLAELFDAAEHGQAIILFDEADSLFGKRTDVRSSNDRYANLETNYLLQRLEAFDGICVLTTNHESAIDPAFLRRLSIHIRVPMPDEDHRQKLWRAMLPSAAKVAGDIDFDGLATKFVMSGGYIKNAVLRAAYMAASEDSAIENAHFWRAARAEYEGMGKLAMRSGT